MVWQMLAAALAALWLTTLVATVALLRAKEEQVARLATFAQGQQAEIERLQEMLRQALGKLSSMHRQGFISLPEDAEFGSYALTPEFEAEIEDGRLRAGGISPEDIVGD